MNVFQSTYDHRLRDWRDLRNSISQDNLEESVILVDRWWQRAPLVNHHLHWNDIENWPDPWTLLSENTYSTLTRALGICYTLIMVNIPVEIIEVSDAQCEDQYLVSVDSAKYLANYWPDSVLNISLEDFTVKRSIPLDILKQKLK